jgi:hypothetical protein
MDRRGGGGGSGAVVSGAFEGTLVWGRIVTVLKLKIDVRSRPGFKLEANGRRLPSVDGRGRHEMRGRNVGRFDGRVSGFEDLDEFERGGCIGFY